MVVKRILKNIFPLLANKEHLVEGSRVKNDRQ